MTYPVNTREEYLQLAIEYLRRATYVGSNLSVKDKDKAAVVASLAAISTAASNIAALKPSTDIPIIPRIAPRRNGYEIAIGDLPRGDEQYRNRESDEA